MQQQIELSEELIAEAQAIAEASGRSVADQIELWSRLGRALEPLLRGNDAEVCGNAGEGRPLSEAIREVSTEKGRERVREYLKSRPYPHFEAVPGRPGLLKKIDADGTETIGKFVNRAFEPVDS